MEGILESFFWSGSNALSPFLYVVIFLETAMAQRLRACIFFVNARQDKFTNFKVKKWPNLGVCQLFYAFQSY